MDLPLNGVCVPAHVLSFSNTKTQQVVLSFLFERFTFLLSAKGNITPAAEYNFYCDPDAAQIVLTQIGFSTKLICWETATTACGFQWVSHFT